MYHQYSSPVCGYKAVALVTLKFATIITFLHDIYQLIHHFTIAPFTSTPTCGTELLTYEMGQHENSKLHSINPFTKSLPVSAPRSGAKRQTPSSNTRTVPKPNYWEPIMMRHAKDLDYLPVPPRYFARREKMATMSRRRKDQDRYKVSLRHLLRGEEQRQIPPRRNKECFRWVLEPMTEKWPEPMPGVPTITVTDPNGKTWWPKDTNSYITMKQEAVISARVMKQHHGPNSEAHCAAFQEAYRKGLENKPRGMRPEVLYCFDCWTRQEKIEQEEARIADQEARIVEDQTTIEKLLSAIEVA